MNGKGGEQSHEENLAYTRNLRPTILQSDTNRAI